jgi:histidinol-phosphate aminotransferase
MSNIRNIKSVLGLLEPYDPGLFPSDITQRYGIPENKIVNLSSNENPYPPPKRLIRRIAEVLESANRYPNPSYAELKEAISEYVGLPPDHIAVGNGSSDLIDLTCKVILTPLDKVVIPVPTYALYMLTSMIWETSIMYVETEDSQFRLTAKEIKPFLDGAKLIFLGSPNNPTGIGVEKDELSEMLKAKDATFVVDEAYYEFSDKTAVDLIEKHKNLIILRSMSKYFCLAGFRIGYALSNPVLAAGLEKVRLPFNINSLAQNAAVLALQNPEYFRKICEEIIFERDRLTRELERIGLRSFPSEANFLMVQLPEGRDVDKFTEELASRGIIVRSLNKLLGLPQDYFRVTVGTKSENRRFIRACKTILSA